MLYRPCVVAFCVVLAAGVPAAAAWALPPGPAAPSVPADGLVHKVVTFPKCQEVRRCAPDRYGRHRCGPYIRCQECKYVKVCGGALGCRWEEKCLWGPYKPPLKTN